MNAPIRDAFSFLITKTNEKTPLFPGSRLGSKALLQSYAKDMSSGVEIGPGPLPLNKGEQFMITYLKQFPIGTVERRCC